MNRSGIAPTVSGMARSVLPVVALLALAVSCGDDPDGRGLPIIRATSGAAPTGAEMAATSPMVDDKMMYRPVDWNFVVGDLPALDSPAWAWVLRGGARPSESQLSSLADYFDIAGGFTERTEGAGESWEYTTWMAGSTDGSKPSINVSNDAMLSWWYSEGYGEVVAVAGCALPPEVQPADSSVPVSEPLVASEPCGPPMDPPAGVPSKAEAIDKFRDMVRALGYSADDMAIDAWADDWAASVTGWLKLDGVRSPMSMSASYGENGTLTWASGVLAAPEKFAEYPRIGTKAALERMTKEYNAPWTGGPMMRSGAVAIDAMPIEPVSPDSMPPDSVPVNTMPVDTMPVEPETITVAIEGVEEELVYVWSEDGAVYLVPGYAFLATQDGYQSRYLVSAMPDAYVQQAAPSEVVTTDDGTTGSGSIDDSSGVDVPAGAEQELVGLSEKDAVARAESQGWLVRVVSRDGEDFAVTADYSSARVNLTIVKDAVTAVYVG